MMKKKFLKLTILSIIPAAVVCGRSFAETVVFKQGTKVEGKLLQRTAKTITIDSRGLPVTYPLDTVESINGVPIHPPPAAAAAEPVSPTGEQPAAEKEDRSDFKFDVPVKEFKPKNIPMSMLIPVDWSTAEWLEGLKVKALIREEPRKENGITVQIEYLQRDPELLRLKWEGIGKKYRQPAQLEEMTRSAADTLEWFDRPALGFRYATHTVQGVMLTQGNMLVIKASETDLIRIAMRVPGVSPEYDQQEKTFYKLFSSLRFDLRSSPVNQAVFFFKLPGRYLLFFLLSSLCLILLFITLGKLAGGRVRPAVAAAAAVECNFIVSAPWLLVFGASSALSRLILGGVILHFWLGMMLLLLISWARRAVLFCAGLSVAVGATLNVIYGKDQAYQHLAAVGFWQALVTFVLYLLLLKKKYFERIA